MRLVSVSGDNKKDTMPKNEPKKLPLLEKIFAGGCLAALGTSMASESAFTMTILSVTVLAIVSLFLILRKEHSTPKGCARRMSTSTDSTDVPPTGQAKQASGSRRVGAPFRTHNAERGAV